ncbi:PKD domain-containing protein [Parasediminibacterium sp. JCM 36343]|uniref:PKD domain-containing protein n=1 Tax=Parasediminibacterium sp. JCM 36343 TaxID=3374279 RepID=UPI00397E4B5D
MDDQQTQANYNAQEMVLYFTTDKDSAIVNVEMPANGYRKTYKVKANQVTESDPLPKSGAQDARINDTGTFNRGIHIYSDKDIVAYAHIYNSSISGATLLLPTAVLGKEYYSINYTQSCNDINANSFCFVVATEDNTTVEITPAADNNNGISVGKPFNVVLNKGQIYNVMGTIDKNNGKIGSDLTGTHIRSIATPGTTGCKKIAVFSGSGKMSIGYVTPSRNNAGGNQTGSADNLFAQAIPASAWGLHYLTAPTGSQPNNYYRICVSDPTTIVKLNGVVIPSAYLLRNFFYELKNSQPLSVAGDGTKTVSTAVPNDIEADKPITIAQYCTTQNTDGNPASLGDPEMIYLSSVEQTINNITLNSTRHYQITEHWINVIIGVGGVKSFTLDGVSRTGDFKVHPQNPNYAYAKFSVPKGSHSLYSDTGFNAIAYGFGANESYGYNAGTNVKDLYQPVFQNPYARLDFAATCTKTPFTFAVPLSYQPTTLTWDFGNNPNLSPSNTVGPIASPVYDSTNVIGGKHIYYYSTNTTYSFSKSGNDTIMLYTTNPTPDGCNSNTATLVVPVVVNDKPTANFVTSNTKCLGDNLQFTDATSDLGASTVISGVWDFVDGSPAPLTQLNPLHQFPAAGTYKVKYRAITNFGCSGDTVLPVTIYPLPVGNFGISVANCIKDSIVFSDSSTISSGTVVKRYWDYGNGVKDTLTTIDSKPQVYTAAGQVTVTLVTESANGCKSAPVAKTFTVHPLPIPDFSTPGICLPAGSAIFNNATTVADNSTLTYYWLFGDGGIDSVTTPAHNYVTGGPFTVKLTATSQYGCKNDTSKIVANIYAQQKAGFSVSKEVCLGDSTVYLDQTVAATGNTIVKWHWDFGDGSAIDTTPNPKHLYAAAGTDSVRFFVYTDHGCPSDTVVKATVVNPLPTAIFDITTPQLCETRPISFADRSKANVGNIVSWHWDFKDGTTLDATNGNPVIHTYPVWKNDSTKLAVQTDKGCKSDTTKLVAVSPLPKVGFTMPDICLSDKNASFLDTSHIADNTELSFKYHWRFDTTITAVPLNKYPTPPTATGYNPSVAYRYPADYVVIDSVTSSNGCTSVLAQTFTVNGANPVAGYKVLQPARLCSNDSVRILNTSTVDFGRLVKVEVYWDYANNPTVKDVYANYPDSGQVYSHIYSSFLVTNAATKQYKVRLVAFSGTQCSNEITQTVTLIPVPKVQFTTMPGICHDTTARQITQASEVTGIPKASDVFSGMGVSATGLFTPQSIAPGKDSIQYKFTSTNGCSDSTKQAIVTWPSPVAKWGINSPACERQAVTFTDSSVAKFSNIAQWEWNFGDATTAVKNTGAPFTKIYTTASQNGFNASLRVITDSGCRSVYNTQKLAIQYTPVPDFELPVSVCLPDGNATFTSTTTIGDKSSLLLINHAWDFGDPNDPTPSTSVPIATHRYTSLPSASGFPVKLTVTKNGCSESTTKYFTAVHPQPKAKFTAIPSAVCKGDSIYFTDATISQSPVTKWKWDLAEGFTDTVRNPARAFNDSGIFTITMYSYNQQNCISDTAKQTVTINPYPHLELGDTRYVFLGSSIRLKPVLVYNDSAYLWSPSTYLDDPTAREPLCTPIFNKQYKLTLTGKGSCSISDVIDVVVVRDLEVANAFSPNGDHVNDTWKINNIESYPKVVVEIFDRSGQPVYRSEGYNNQNGWDGTYNGKPLPVATYYYIITPHNGKQTKSGSITLIR